MDQSNTTQPAPLGQLSTEGCQESTLRVKKSAVKAVARFLEAAKEQYRETDWLRVDPSLLCTQAFWKQYAHWLVSLKDGSSLSAGTIQEYLRKFLQLVHKKYGNRFSEFFIELDTTGHLAWFQGLLGQVHVAKFKDAVASSEAVQKQAEPLYIEQRKDISKHLRLAPDNKHDNALQNSVIQCNGFVAGRPGTSRCH